MIDYMLNGLQLFILGSTVLALLGNAPARWRLWVSLTALIGTVMPWHLLPPLQLPIAMGYEFGRVLQSSFVTSAGSSQPLPLPTANLIAVALLIGIAAFGVIVARQLVHLGRWRSNAYRRDDLLRLASMQGAPDSCRLWIVHNSRVAGSTALPFSEVWIGDYFLSDPRLNTVVAHEVCHVLARDPKIDWMLVFTRSLFWWHPLVWFWVWQARRQMELACDERCANALGRRKYQLELAELVRHACIFREGVSMMRSDSFNIKRLKRLTNKPQRMKRHSAGVLAAVLIAALSLVNISASAQGDAFTVCPDDIEMSSVMQADEGARLKLTLRDSAADRLSEATVDRVGERMVLTDSRGTVLEGVSLTIQAPLHKDVQLVLSSEPTAMRLQSYFQGDRCTYE